MFTGDYVSVLEGEPDCQSPLGGRVGVGVHDVGIVDICLEESPNLEVVGQRIFSTDISPPHLAARRYVRL